MISTQVLGFFFLQMMIKKNGREKSCVHRDLVVALNVQRTSITAKSEFQMTTTDHGFSLKSGFKKI